jgi:Zn-dependent alcohol dehydrogenase
MKAAVCYEFGKPLVIEDIVLSPVRRNEVRVRMAATAICHTDVHVISGDWAFMKPPLVAGHESSGIVEEVGENVATVKPGDHVVVSLVRSCGRCHFCVSGEPQWCRGTFDDESERYHNSKGERLAQVLHMGSFAEYTVVDQSQVVPIPADMPLDRAALIACGVITGVGAVVNTAKVRPGQNVVVFGTGGVGLNAIQGAVLCGADPIIAIDLLDNKLEAAKAFGATHTINATRENAIERVRQITGRGADFVFSTVGAVQATADGFQMLTSGGLVIVVGQPQAGASITIPVEQFLFGGRGIRGCNMGATRLSTGIPWLVSLYRQGRKARRACHQRYPWSR